MKIRFLLLSFLLTLSIVYTGSAGTIKDDFEDGEIADFWDPFPEALARPELAEIIDDDEHDGILDGRTKAASVRVLWLTEPINGNFEVSIEYHDYPPNQFSDTKLEIQIRDAGDPANTYRRLAVESSGSPIMFSGKDAGAWVDNNSVGSYSSPDGKLVMIKEGAEIHAVVWDGDKEVAIAKVVAFDHDPVIISLWAQAWGGTELAQGTFDNFNLTGPQVPNLDASPVDIMGKLAICWGSLKQ